MELMHGNCLDLLSTLEPGSIDMVLADPPYGTTKCKWDSVIPFGPMWWLLKRAIKPNGAVVMMAGQPFTSALIMSNIKMFKHEWIWEKNRGINFGNTIREPMKEHEHTVVFANKKWTYNPVLQERKGGGRLLVGKMVPHNCKEVFKSTGDFSGYKKKLSKLRVPSSIQKFNCEVGLHPTQKPTALMEYLIKTYTDPGQIVVDFSMGSGTTGVAAVRTGRDFIGIELDEKYFNIARDRINLEIIGAS